MSAIARLFPLCLIMAGAVPAAEQPDRPVDVAGRGPLAGLPGKAGPK